MYGKGEQIESTSRARAAPSLATIKDKNRTETSRPVPSEVAVHSTISVFTRCATARTHSRPCQAAAPFQSPTSKPHVHIASSAVEADHNRSTPHCTLCAAPLDADVAMHAARLHAFDPIRRSFSPHPLHSPAARAQTWRTCSQVSQSWTWWFRL